MSPVLFSITKQGYLCTRVRQSSVWAEPIQTVLCTPQRTAQLTVCQSTGMKGEDAVAWHQYMIPTDMPSTAGGSTAITFLRMGQITHIVN